MGFAFQLPTQISGVVRSGRGGARHVGEIVPFHFDVVAALADGVAVSTIQATLAVPVTHRLRGVYASASDIVIVAGGTDPAVDVYRHLPLPGAPTVALTSPAAAGNVEDGAHLYAVAYVNAAGTGTPGPTASVTVADKTVNGKIAISGVPIGPTGTTQRKIYRTKTGATALLLQQTIANNTATTGVLDNTADAGLGAAAETANGAAASVLSATIKLSESASNRELNHQPVAGVLADPIDPTIWDPCVYTLRAVTGAATGAITNLKGLLLVELFASEWE